MNCDSNRINEALRTESLTQEETEQVDSLLKNLYQSFSYGKAEEPDWELMRSVFFEGALFVPEVPEGESPNPQTIEEFISSWQNSIRNSDSPTIATTERILETKTSKIGKMIRVEVVFQALKATDLSLRKYGLDSLVLANIDGVWKILSFIIHYESKL
tara:strand:+ start:212 stop:685 length:474 start_codon:yes stop_codon:yes gene_type:complete